MVPRISVRLQNPREAPAPDSVEVPRFDEPLLLRIFYSKDVRESFGEKLHDRG